MGYKFSTYALSCLYYGLETSVLKIKRNGIPVNLYQRIQPAIAAVEEINEKSIYDDPKLEKEVVKLVSNPALPNPVNPSVAWKVMRSLNMKNISLPDENGERQFDIVAKNNTEEAAIQNYYNSQLFEILDILPERKKEIIKMRYGFYGTPMTLEEVGKKFGITREFVRQIEIDAIRRLRKYIFANTQFEADDTAAFTYDEEHEYVDKNRNS